MGSDEPSRLVDTRGVEARGALFGATAATPGDERPDPEHRQGARRGNLVQDQVAVDADEDGLRVHAVVGAGRQEGQVDLDAAGDDRLVISPKRA